MCNSLRLERSTHKIEIHGTCQQVSVSKYKDYVQSVSQQADVLQHHMPGLCAFSRGKQMQKKKHTHSSRRVATHTKPRSISFDFFFLEKVSFATPRGASHASMCPHAPTHVRTKHSSSALTLFAKEKSSLGNILTQIPAADQQVRHNIRTFPIYIINLSTYTVSPHIIMKTICNFTSYKQTPQHLLETGINTYL